MGPCQTHTHTLSLSLSLCSSLSHTSVSPFHPPLSNSFIVSSAVVAAFAEKRTRRTCTSIKTGLSQEIRDLIAGKCLEPRVISPVYRDSVAPLRLFPPRRPPPNQRYPFRVVGSFLDPSFNCPCSGKAFSFSRLTKQVADCDFFLDRRNFLSWRRAGKAGKSLEGFRRRGTLIRGLVWRSMTIDALILICRVIDVTNIDIRVSFFFFFYFDDKSTGRDGKEFLYVRDDGGVSLASYFRKRWYSYYKSRWRSYWENWNNLRNLKVGNFTIEICFLFECIFTFLKHVALNIETSFQKLYCIIFQ